MRLFFAVKLPPSVESEIAKFMEQFYRYPGKVKWVEPHNIHITLKFLGETDETLLSQLKSTAAEVAGLNKGSFDLSFSGCGAFPNLRSPRVFWIGIVDEEKRLTALAAALDNKLSELGFERESRKFSPHLTVGRVKFPSDLEKLTGAFKQAEFQAVNMTVSEFYLVESVLKPSGPVYTALEKFIL